MELRWVSDAGIESRNLAELPELLEREDGFLWLDIPVCDDSAAALLSDTFGFHPHAVKDCQEKRRIPKVHTYSDHVFLILHALEFEEEGMGTHGRAGPVRRGSVPGHRSRSRSGLTCPPKRRSARRVRCCGGSKLERCSRGCPPSWVTRSCPRWSCGLEQRLSSIAEQVAVLEHSIVRDEKRNPQEVIEQLYRLRHQLLLIRTTASLSREVYAGRRTLARSTGVSPERIAIIEDIIDQYEHLSSLCDAEKGFLDQVLAFHEARTVTKMNIAMERLALIAAILLPVSAISGIYGMNVIVNDQTDFPHVGGCAPA